MTLPSADDGRNATIRRRLIPALCAVVGLCLSFDAAALTANGVVDDVAYSVYAPDWTWQNRDVNVLVVLENRSDAPREVRVQFGIPRDRLADFGVAGKPVAPDETKTTAEAHLGPKESTRLAFTEITPLAARADGSKVPLGDYALSLRIQFDDVSATVPYPLRTIRGQAFSGGRWVALLAPTAVALVWCLAFALALRRFAATGAWKKPPSPVNEPEKKEPWIDRNPA